MQESEFLHDLGESPPPQMPRSTKAPQHQRGARMFLHLLLVDEIVYYVEAVDNYM